MKYLRRIDLCWGFCVGFVLFCIGGCGDGLPRRVPVSGVVLLDGKPLEQGTVQVFPKDQRLAYGNLGPGGKFTLTTFTENDGCMMGKHPVAVIAYESIGSYKIKWFAPKKYMEPSTSGLEIDVPGSRDDVVINITWGSGKPFIENISGK